MGPLRSLYHRAYLWLALGIFTIANLDNFQILNSGKLAIVVMSEYRVGIIGYGWAATAHIEAINATRQGQVAAVYSSRPLDTLSVTSMEDRLRRIKTLKTCLTIRKSMWFPSLATRASTAPKL